MADARGRIRDTYVAAIQFDKVEIPDGALKAGIARRPMPWFSSAVDVNLSQLGPPQDLLDDFKERARTLEGEGVDPETAHNRAWDDVDYEPRYRDHLRGEDAQGALHLLLDELRDGRDVVLVCYEAPEKRCHRTLVRDALEEALSGATKG